MTLEEMFRRIVRAHLALILVCILVPVAGAAILVANRPDPSIASIRLQVISGSPKSATEAEGMNSLGLLVEYQRGELDEAQTWYRRAAEAGHSEAMFNLGALLRGRGESDEAETWYRRAAATGHNGAKLSLTRLLERRSESEEDLSPG